MPLSYLIHLAQRHKDRNIVNAFKRVFASFRQKNLLKEQHLAYEREVSRLISHLYLDGGVCIDVGAGIGAHSLIMSERVGHLGQVFAFEINAHNFNQLELNIKANHVRNITAHKGIVGHPSLAGRTMINANLSADDRDYSTTNISTGAIIEAPVININDRLRAFPDRIVKLIKIDAGGFECNVLRSMKLTLMRNPEAVLIVKVFPEALRAVGSSAVDLMQLILELGATGWELHEGRIIPMAHPGTYGLIRDGSFIYLVAARNTKRLKPTLAKLYS